MIIKKYLASTEMDAIEKAMSDLGPKAVVMSRKKIERHGIMKIFFRTKYEVTAALDENTEYNDKEQTPKGEAHSPGGHVDIKVPPMEELPPLGAPSLQEQEKEVEEKLSKLSSYFEKELDNKTSQKEQPKKETEKKPQAVKKDTGTDKENKNREKAVSSEKSEPKKKDDDKLSVAVYHKGDEKEDDELKPPTETTEKSAVYRELIYKQLIENEVEASVADSILDEVDRSLPENATINQILASVYQRIILMIGQPYVIDVKPNDETKYIFFIGSTGVGKTTTIAKIASVMKLKRKDLKIALATADTYRIAAKEQLEVYANILSVPFKVAYKPEDLGGFMDDLEKYDICLIDTAGCSHKNKEQIADVKKLLEQIPISKRQVYLVLNVGTKYNDLKEIAKVYSELTDYSIIFTKLDETSSAGVMLNMKVNTGCPLSYVTDGQNVPDDISRIDAQKVAKELLSR